MASVTVIGIDPGSVCTGWGVVREESGVLRLVDCGAIRVKDSDFSARLASIGLNNGWARGRAHVLLQHDRLGDDHGFQRHILMPGLVASAEL